MSTSFSKPPCHKSIRNMDPLLPLLRASQDLWRADKVVPTGEFITTPSIHLKELLAFIIGFSDPPAYGSRAHKKPPLHQHRSGGPQREHKLHRPDAFDDCSSNSPPLATESFRLLSAHRNHKLADHITHNTVVRGGSRTVLFANGVMKGRQVIFAATQPVAASKLLGTGQRNTVTARSLGSTELYTGDKLSSAIHTKPTEELGRFK